MKMFRPFLCLVTVISLLLSVITHSTVQAQVAPTVKPLGMLKEGLDSPGRLAVDQEGNIYVANYAGLASNVLKYDKYGRLKQAYSGFHMGNRGLAVTPDGSRLFVSGWTQATIVDGVTGEIVGYLGKAEDEFGTPVEIDLDADGNVYIGDHKKSNIRVFNQDGVEYPERKFGSFGVGANKFISIWAMSIDRVRGEIYVADCQDYSTSKPNLQIFGLDGTLRRTYLATATAYFGSPAITFVGGIAFDNQGRAYFPDSFWNNIRVVRTATNSYLSRFGEGGNGLGQTRYAKDIVFDPGTSRVFVASDGGKVEIFGIDGGVTPVRSNAAPTLPELLEPTTASIVATRTPELLLRNGTDADGDALTHSVRLTLGETLVGEFVSVPAGEELSVVRLAAPLLEGATYSWSAQASDGEKVSGWTAPQTFLVQTNRPPSIPVPLSPAGDSEIASATPELAFQNATDADGDLLTYQIRVYRDDALLLEMLDLPQGESVTSVIVQLELQENARHQWSVQASDGRDISGWSGLQSFYVNAIAEPPAAPQLLAPAAGAVLEGADLLAWGEAVDPDPFDTVVYRLQIAGDDTFTALLAEENLAGTSLTLAQLADYGDLLDGNRYFWRVLAIDNHGLLSEPSTVADFVYDTTLLRVATNMPGAKVYRGGNLAYSGAYLGEAPLEVRDLDAGVFSLVVERAGFETSITQITLADRENADIHLQLIPAIAPDDLKARTLNAGGDKLLVGDQAVPFAVDFNNNGTLDLLVGNGQGQILLFVGTIDEEGEVSFAAGVPLPLEAIPGAAPLVVDWNRDGRKDLLVGTASGTVKLYLNSGSEEAPVFAEGVFLQADGAPISVGSFAVPAVIDRLDDGRIDLVVGSAAGIVYNYPGLGSDGERLLGAGQVLFDGLSAYAAPTFVDWNADGRRDLLLATSQHLYVHLQSADGSFAPSQVLTVGDALAGAPGKGKGGGAYSLGERLRVFAVDLDGKKGKDLLVGNAAGEVRLASSNGKELVAAFARALADKVAQMQEVAGADEYLDQAGKVADLAAAVLADANNVQSTFNKLLDELDADGELARVVGELQLLVKER